MNERIRELMAQAGFDPSAIERMGIMPQAEKFAELIVKECIQVAVYRDDGYMHPANVSGYMATGRSTAAQMIKEHFGVKE